jgi:osmotically-inducible protein OsmY
MAGKDDTIRHRVEQLAASMDEPAVVCTVEDGRVLLEGSVSSDERSYQLEDAARGLAGVQAVRNELALGGFEASVESTVEGLDLMPDFTSTTGAGDPMESASEAEPYFPPTDPVITPGEDGRAAIQGGFAHSADEDVVAANLPQSGVPQGDDEIRNGVIAALRADAATTDLDVQVLVRDGVVVLRGSVSSLDEADLAESIAAAVRGVEEVREELEVEGL